ncbi:MAG: M15 family metallopeptidase [Dermatophilaceae bacterium]
MSTSGAIGAYGMSTSGAIGAYGMGAGVGRPRGSYVPVAGRPRRVRQRRRAIELCVASLAVLLLIGQQIRGTTTDPTTTDPTTADPTTADPTTTDPTTADPTTADPTTAGRPLTVGSTVPRQQDAAPVIDNALPVIDNALPVQPPPEDGAIDPALSRALGKARIAAQTAGLDLQVTSGFRSAATQQRLYDQAIAKYGSPEKARRWVLPPAESAHVKGLAVDVGPPAAAAWLETYGVRYGRCRRYVNEGWHFERLAPAVGQQCPAMERHAGG